MPKYGMPKHGMLMIKLLVMSSAIGWAVHQGVLQQSLIGIKKIHITHLLIAWICMGLGVLLGPLRWSLLLTACRLNFI